MRHFVRSAATAVAALFLASCGDTPTQPHLQRAGETSNLTAPTLVISQVYGGGGNSGAIYKNDFIEIFNPGSAPVSLGGWSVQYASAAGTTWQVTALTNVTLQPGAYYLVQEAAGSGGTTNLPTPDATGAIAMSGTAGKVIVVQSTTAQTGTCPAAAVDRISFGSGSTDCGGGITATLGNTTSASRKTNGCTYTATMTDFAVGTVNPRNTSAPTNVCGNTEVLPVATVTIAPDSAESTVNGTQQFTATAKDSTGAAATTTFTWLSSDTTIAKVDSTGKATARAAGLATISATSANGKIGTAKFNVVAVADTTGDLVISQVFGGGGNSGAVYLNDYIEIFNRGNTPVTLTGWKVSYGSAASTTWQSTPLTGVIQPHQYVLVQEAAGTSTTAIALPTPDVIGTLAMGATAGKIVLTRPGTTPSGACPTGSGIADKVGYGTNTTANGCATEWGGRTADLSNTTAAFRANDGCINNGVTTGDWGVFTAAPRNSTVAAKNCSQPTRPQSTFQVAVNELMADPANAESASWGQWFELYNYGSSAVNLRGWTIVSPGTNQPDHVINTDVIVQAGGYAVLGRGADTTRNGNVKLDYNYFVGGSSTIWLDARDFLMMVDNVGARVDSVAWTSLPHGVTKGLRDATQPHADVDGANWGYSTANFGNGDYGTPGAANGTLATTAPIVSANTIAISGRVATDAPLPVGFEAQLFATETDPNGVVLTGATFTWTALTPNIATIDARGVIHAVSAGGAVFRIVSSNGAVRTHSLQMVDAAPSTTAQYLNNTAFGDLTPGAQNTTDYIVRRPQYVTSYNATKGTPNWVAYDLNGTQIVSGQDRCNCFTMDPLLPSSFTRLSTADYTGAGSFAGYGIDRGHMVRSFDRTSGALDNALTYYLDNVVPQAADMNQGPWANFENYLGNLAQTQNKEVYIYAGPAGSKGTVKNEGLLTIPTHTWKVAIIMNRAQSNTDVRDYRDLQVISVVMPNEAGVRNVDWATSYVVSLDSVEHLTGYRFLTTLPAKVSAAAHSGAMPPLAYTDGPWSGNEGSNLSFSAATSADPNGSIVSYAWDFGDGSVGSGINASHTYVRSGNYAVRLIVTDNSALADTVVLNAQVANVAPVVGAVTLSAASQLPGASLTASASFSDAGTGNTHTALINWGDAGPALSVPVTETDGAGTLSGSHVYSVPGAYTVTITVIDDLGLSHSSSAVYVVTQPTATAATNGPWSGNEGSSISMSGAGSSSEVGAITTYAWNFGDGTTGSGATVSHAYGKHGDYTVTLTVTNAFGYTSQVTSTVTVANVAPVAGNITTTVDAPLPGHAVTVSVPFTDAGTDDTHTATIAWGDGTTSSVTPTEANGVGSLAGVHAYAAPGSYTITVTISDCGALDGTATTTFVVNALPPVAAIGGATSGVEGTALALNGASSSTPFGTVTSYAWSFGDGAVGTGAAVSHSYNRFGDFTVKLVVTNSFGLKDSTTTVVHITDVAPVITTLTTPTAAQKEGQLMTLTAAASDVGTGDVHNAVIAWGDGSTSPATLTESNGVISVSAQHRYTDAGLYTATVTVNTTGGLSTSRSSGTIVVVDMDNGNLEAEGWITSPTGACTSNALCGDLRRNRLKFSLEAKYEDDRRTRLKSEVKIDFEDEWFKSRTAEWLVVSGGTAVLRGTGSIRGFGSYDYLISALDGNPPRAGTDRIRIKIWNRATGEVVYDTNRGAGDASAPTVALGGGKVKVKRDHDRDDRDHDRE